LRTSNPIESVFSTVRHRTVRTKGSLSSATAKLMVFKLQADQGGLENLAAIERRKTIAESHRGCQIPRWNRGHRNAVTERRLITPSPKFQRSSRKQRYTRNYKAAAIPMRGRAGPRTRVDGTYTLVAKCD
jgi:hypothetical protein